MTETSVRASFAAAFAEISDKRLQAARSAALAD